MEKQEIIFLNSVFFVLGFTIVFAVVGILLQTLLSHIEITAMNALRLVGGIIIVLFGLMLIASTKYIIPFFNTEHKIHPKRLQNSYAFSLLFGLSFAIGWTPCVGAILGSIYVFAASSPGIGFLLLLAYAFGLGIPFLLVGAFTSKFAGFLNKSKRFLKYFNIVSGLFLVAMGLLVITGYIGLLSIFLISQNGGMISLSNQLNFLIAIAAGVLTFLSPCILPLVPAYLSYMAGTTVSEVAK
jgi:cytochrome c-type biogenesis protein